MKLMQETSMKRSCSFVEMDRARKKYVYKYVHQTKSWKQERDEEEEEEEV